MFAQLPRQIEAVESWGWPEIEPYYQELETRELSADTAEQWLADWTAINDLVAEKFSRVRLATTQDTSDEEADAQYKHLLETVFPKVQQANNTLNKKLVASGIEPDNFEIPLKKMRNAIEIFREANLPLSAREQALGMEFARVMGAQTVEWEGEEVTLVQLQKVFQDDDRETREKAWRLHRGRWLEDREKINDLWVQFFKLRQEMAANAGLDNYRDYAWKMRHRFDYTPQDCETFHDAIEQIVVPAAIRANERRRKQMGIDTLRPWDLDVDPLGREPLRPWDTIESFQQKAETIFKRVDPILGGYYTTMRQEDLMDLPNRKNKGPGAYCTSFPMTARPFVFMNATGTRSDVRTLLHEFGHAFHGFEVLENQPYSQQRAYPIEFAEVASMAMELLAAPYLREEQGGYYSANDAARDRVGHLEKILFFWPYMTVVDAFQHWAYTSGDAAADPANCDAKWAELWDRFIKVDYTGLEDIKETGWQRKHHIFRYPFYYIEYGLAQLGAIQVWANALEDQAGTVKQYRQALALGGTRSIPELYEAAGVKFAFDAHTLGEAVNLIERTIEEQNALA